MIDLDAATYRFGITGFDRESTRECPLFTYMVRTEFGAKLVRRRLEEQGFLTAVYDTSKGDVVPGLNPYFHDDL